MIKNTKYFSNTITGVSQTFKYSTNMPFCVDAQVPTSVCHVPLQQLQFALHRARVPAHPVAQLHHVKLELGAARVRHSTLPLRRYGNANRGALGQSADAHISQRSREPSPTYLLKRCGNVVSEWGGAMWSNVLYKIISM